MKTGALLGVVAMISFSIWPFWQWLQLKKASGALSTRTEALIAKHPELKPAWKIAMLDGVLTYDEAKEIVEAAGEKLGPND